MKETSERKKKALRHLIEVGEREGEEVGG